MRKLSKLSGLLIGILFAMVTVAAWGLANRPTAEPAWPRTIQGFAFQPYQKHQDEIDADLERLEGKTFAVRTYSTTGTLGQIPELARKHGIRVMLGAWLDTDLE